MAQMLIEKPMNYAMHIGYPSEGYKELIERLENIKLNMKPEMHRIISVYETNEKIRRIIEGSIPKEGSYHRGSLVSIICGLDDKKSITLSALVELFYWATAWLDDIADENTLRQNTLSPRMSHGNTVALYISNTLYGIVFRVLYEEFKEDNKKLAELIKYFSTNFHLINRAQAIDVLLSKKKVEEVTIEEYMSLIEGTTGVDIASTICMGAVISGFDEKTTNSLWKFGIELGTLAQIRDDVLDYCDVKYEDEYVIGKIPFRDIETEKKRLPLLITRDVKQRNLSGDVYAKIENDFIIPRKKKAIKNLEESDIPKNTKNTLKRILDYWSDIRIFQYFMLPRQ